MKTITPQLPTVLGSFAAMLVAFLSLMSGTAPSACLMKAAAAFLVFAGFGLILRYILMDTVEEPQPQRSGQKHPTPDQPHAAINSLDVIVPGTSVANLLGSVEGDQD